MKRANGTGSIVKLSGNRRRPYMVKVSGVDRYGHIVQQPLSYHAKVSEAQAALEEYNAMREAGRTVPVDKARVTLQEIYDGWSGRAYSRYQADGRKSSLNSYKSAWSRVRHLAQYRMAEITLDQLQQILDECEREGRSQSTITNVVILLKALYRYAMERDYVRKDLTEYLEVPHMAPIHEKGSLTEEQLMQVGEMAAEGVPWADSVLVLCYTGFRVSELLQLTCSSYHQEDGGYLVGGVKTAAGRGRIIPIHPRIEPYIKSWAERGEKDFFRMSPSTYRSRFSELAKQIGANAATPHWCRHTFASRLHAAGVDPLTTKWLMGHSTANDITAHYTHGTILELRAAILRLP